MSSFHVIAGAAEGPLYPAVRRIGLKDVGAALRLGLDDFGVRPSHYVFLCLIYPLVGVALAAWTSGGNALPMLFPLMSGFALVGPLAGLGLYEISRRRELGMDSSWRHAFDVLQSPAIPAILAMGAYLLVVFLAWLFAARAIYEAQFGDALPASADVFLRDLFTTEQGLAVIFWGNLAGLAFAVLVLATTVVAFPLLLDRDVGVYGAVNTSFRAVLANPLPMAAWGLIVALLLAVGSLPLFAGLAVVVPVLGHATWHLYRKVVVPDLASLKAGR